MLLFDRFMLLFDKFMLDFEVRLVLGLLVVN
jgi:hypothetical protein